jgi:hypothetical protein
VTRQEINLLCVLRADFFEESGRDCPRLEKRLDVALIAEQRALSAVLRHQVTTLEDMAAKASHIRSLLCDGDEGLEKFELDVLLSSLMHPTPRPPRRKRKTGAV